MGNDGVSQSEKVDLLFKNYLNFTTTNKDYDFYQETDLANNTNIFSNNILQKSPPLNPSYTTVTSDVSLSTYLAYSGLPVNIDNTWFTDKTTEGSFSVNAVDDADRSVLRLEKIKLDYLGNGTAALVCNDKNGINILQNIIPSNYSTSGYSLSLEYKYGNNALKNIGWLAKRSANGENFGGALFDAKNGVITFYDMNGSPGTVLTNGTFYLTCTKYIGKKGVSVIDSNLTVNGELHGPATFVIDPKIVGDNTGLVVIKGGLQVDGTTTTINSTTIDISDLQLELGANSINSQSSIGGGINCLLYTSDAADD